ncbi:MAG: universal stress protein, partial [Myxococcales bacterium]|nr:universal stress protein [Myxococcales bacterium]
MKKFLVGVDGSPRERQVLAAAVDMARRVGARLVVLRAARISTELPPEAYLMAEDDVNAVLERRAKVAVDDAVKGVPPHLVERVRVEVDEPWRAICRAAVEDDVDLIVIGAHGYGMVDRLLGTTAALGSGAVIDTGTVGTTITSGS